MVGVLSIAAGVLYTGGPRPYGYEGLGELFVFVFFGLVAVGGSYFVQTEDLRWEAVALGVPVGLLAAAILVVNNVRDVETDRRAGKRTLAVRLGRERARGHLRGDARARVRRGAGRSPCSTTSTSGSCIALVSIPLAVPLARTLSYAARRARRSTSFSPTPAACSPSSRCFSPPASSSRREARPLRPVAPVPRAVRDGDRA